MDQTKLIAWVNYVKMILVEFSSEFFIHFYLTSTSVDQCRMGKIDLDRGWRNVVIFILLLINSTIIIIICVSSMIIIIGTCRRRSRIREKSMIDRQKSSISGAIHLLFELRMKELVLRGPVTNYFSKRTNDWDSFFSPLFASCSQRQYWRQDLSRLF